MGCTRDELAQPFHGDLASLYEPPARPCYRLALKLCRSQVRDGSSTMTSYLPLLAPGVDRRRRLRWWLPLLLTRRADGNGSNSASSRGKCGAGQNSVRTWSPASCHMGTIPSPQGECAGPQSDMAMSWCGATLNTHPPANAGARAAYYEGLRPVGIASQLPAALGPSTHETARGLIPPAHLC